ncbi:MAG: hypothetical protein ACR2M2_00160 [Gaiellaceae bacterium]
MSALVLRWPSLLPASLLLLGGLYGAELALDDPALDGAAPLFAAGLLVTAELGYWSLEECDAVKAEPGESLRRAAFIALLALGALLVGSLLLVLTDGVRAGGLAVDLVGAVAAGAVLVVVVVALRTVRRDETRAD